MVWLFYFILGNKHSCHGLYVLKQPTRKHNSSKQMIGYFSSWNRFCYFYVNVFQMVYVKKISNKDFETTKYNVATFSFKKITQILYQPEK